MAHYLLALGLVNPRVVVEEALTVVDASRRNSVFVATTPSDTFVVKQAGPGGEDTLAHEAVVLRALAPLRVAPELAHYDEAAVRLVLRSPPAALPWGGQARVPRLTAGALGRALGAVHATLPALDAPTGIDRLWGLPEPPLERVREMGSGALELLALIQGSRELCDRLARLREVAAGDAFIHGDLRWDNCLAFPAPGARRRTRVLLIDWELAGRGDPATDLGMALGEYLRAWVADPRRRLERLRPAMRALWEGYRRSGAPAPAPRRVAERAAVRLLHAALERAGALATATVEVRTLLQLADNVLRTPDDAAWGLMGLRA